MYFERQWLRNPTQRCTKPWAFHFRPRPNPTKVLRDYNVRKSVPGAALSMEEKEHWVSSISEFFSTTQRPPTKKSRKLFVPPPRLAALEFCRALDNQLRVGADRRLPDFKVAWAALYERLGDSAPITAAEFKALCPMLVVAMDQGPPQFAATSFLAWHLDINWVCLWDPAAHRCWNDVKLALSHSKLNGTVYSAMILFNYRTGPWNRSAWFKTVCEVVQDLQSTVDADDPLLLWLWNRIADENHWQEPQERDRAARDRFVGSLPNIRECQTKGEAVAMSRWFSWMHKEQSERREWSTRCLILAFYALTSGQIQHADEIHGKVSERGRGEIVRSRMASTSQQEPADGGQTPRAPAADNRTTKQKYDSTMKQALHLSADLDLRDKTRMIGIATRPLTLWHGSCLQNMRGVEKAKGAYIDWATGGMKIVLWKLVGTLDDMEALEECGFIVSCQKAKLRTLSTSSPQVVNQDSVASEMFGFVMKLVKFRALSMMHHTTGYLARLAGLLHEDRDIQQRFEKTLYEDLDDFDTLSRRPEREATKLTKRSIMQIPLMKLCMAMRERYADSFPHALREYIGLIFQGWGQTKINEDANRTVRQVETRGQNSKKVQRVRRWAAPRQEKMIDQWGRAEVTPNSELPCPSSIPDGFFNVTQKIANEQPSLQSITKTTASWPTFGYGTIHNQAADLAVSRVMRAQNAWGYLADLWQVSLLPENQVVRKKGSGDLFFVLHVQEGSAAILWKMLDKGRSFEFMKMGDFEWFVIWDFDDYEVLPVSVASPVRMRLEVGDTMENWCGIRLVKLGVEGALSILQFHVTKCFAGLSEGTLSKLCVHLDIEEQVQSLASGGNKCLDRVAALMRHLKPEMEAEECEQAMLMKRFAEEPEDIDALRELVDDGDLYSVLLAEDIGACKQWAKEYQATKAETVAHKSAAKTSAARVWAAPGFKSGGASSSSRPKRPKPKTPKPHRNWRFQIDEGDVEVVQAMKPDPCTIFVDHYNGAFRIIYGGIRRKSVSWTLRGKVEAIRLALLHAWRLHAEATGEVCPWSELIN